MAHIIVRSLDDTVKLRLQDRARRRGRSMEQEVRDFLRAAVMNGRPLETPLGTVIAARFSAIGLDDTLPEMHGDSARPADFGS